MGWGLDFAILCFIIAVLLVAGMWTAFALIIAGMIVVYLDGGAHRLLAIGDIGWNTNTNFVLTAAPLFIFMGQIIMASGISESFFYSLNQWFARVPGGILSGSIAACTVFAATTGSSVATAAAVGSVAMPEMKRLKYNRSFAAGTLAAGGTLGILIPPSITLILYSSITSVPVTQLFAAGLIPGLLLASSFLVYIMIRSSLNHDLVGEKQARVPLGARIRGSLRMIPVLLLIVTVIGSIYDGIATPTEAAALGVLGALVVSVGRLSPSKLYQAAVNTTRIASMVLSILLGAQFVTYALVETGANRGVTNWIAGQHLSEYELLTAICVLYILLGDFVEGVGMMLMTMPVLYPVALDAGFDPVWFGIVVAILIELGQITPPVGLNLFVLRAFDREIPHRSVVRAALPYAGLMVGMIVLLAAFPGIALWFANQTSQVP